MSCVMCNVVLFVWNEKGQKQTTNINKIIKKQIHILQKYKFDSLYGNKNFV